MRDHLHMQFAKTLMVILGIWPVKLSGWKLKLYNAYFYVSLSYYILYDISQGIMLFISSGILETSRNLATFIVYVINIYKVIICRSVALRTIIKDIELREKLILESDCDNIKQIYRNHVKSAYASSRFYMCFGTTAASVYFSRPLIKTLLEKNSGGQEKYLIFPSWFPFNPDEYYITAYSIQLAGAFYGYSYIVYPGIFLFCILIYSTGQIRILQHIFKNFSDYSDKFSKTTSVNKRGSQEIFTKLCIIEHQNIIQFVHRLDDSIKTFLLLEFLVSSFQFSLIVYQILQSEGFGIDRVADSGYLCTLSVQLFLFYWHAHDIIIQSAEIAQAVFECGWPNLNVKVQKMMQLVIVRAQKPIGISIGPIYRVKMDALIGIFKAIYSYIALIQK